MNFPWLILLLKSTAGRGAASHLSNRHWNFLIQKAWGGVWCFNALGESKASPNHLTAYMNSDQELNSNNLRPRTEPGPGSGSGCAGGRGGRIPRGTAWAVPQPGALRGISWSPLAVPRHPQLSAFMLPLWFITCSCWLWGSGVVSRLCAASRAAARGGGGGRGVCSSWWLHLQVILRPEG